MIVDFPEPLETTWDEPGDFGTALRLHAARHGETIHHLYRAVVRPEDGMNRSTLISWHAVRRLPARWSVSKSYAGSNDAIGCPKGISPGRPPIRTCGDGYDLDDIPASERRRLAWHLPDDFNRRPRSEQAEILDWVRNVIISGATDYRRYQAAAMRQRYAVRFAGVSGPRRKSSIAKGPDESGVIDASAQLSAELADLLKFKTSTFAAFGLQRNGVWGEETASQKIEHFGLWFGAFAAPVTSEVRGFGADPKSFTFAMMVFPRCGIGICNGVNSAAAFIPSGRSTCCPSLPP